MTPLPPGRGRSAARRDRRRSALASAGAALALVGFVVAAVLGDPQDVSGTSPFTLATGSPHQVTGQQTSASGSPARVPRVPDPSRTHATVPDRSDRPGDPPPARPASRPQYYVPGRAVALTFDDGPDPRWTPQILDLLRANHVHATFCLVGTQARAHPDLVRRIVAEGNALCDHSWDHDEHLPAAPAAHVRQEIDSAARTITQASGGVPPRYFRAPGGNWSPVVFGQVAAIGLRPLAWSVDPRDWSRPGVAHISAAVDAARPGDIILCHDGGGDRAQTVQALRTALPALRRRGLAFVFP